MSTEQPEQRKDDVGQGAEEQPSAPRRAGEEEQDRREDEGWSQPESSAQKHPEKP